MEGVDSGWLMNALAELEHWLAGTARDGEDLGPIRNRVQPPSLQLRQQPFRRIHHRLLDECEPLLGDLAVVRIHRGFPPEEEPAKAQHWSAEADDRLGEPSCVITCWVRTFAL